MPHNNNKKELYFRSFDVFSNAYEPVSVQSMLNLKNKIYELYESTTQKLKLKNGLTPHLKESLEEIIKLCELAITQYKDEVSFVEEIKLILRSSYLAVSDPLKFLAQGF